jgi:hypothetical protein
VTLLREAATTYEHTFGRGIWHSLNVIWLGEALLLADRLEDAHSVAERSLALTREYKHRICEPWALRLLGEISSHRDAPDSGTAEGFYRQALVLAEKLTMRPLVAHCHLGLGKINRCTGARDQAREHLTSATAMFREMDMTLWRLPAEAEISQLA